MLNDALELAENGYHVFPLVPRGKRPLTLRGKNDATRDADQIRAWWTEHPDANIGGVVPAGYLVVDIDPRNGGSRESYDLPHTSTSKTGGKGGLHLWYKVEKTHSFPKTLGPGIDTRFGGKHYVVMPPSIHESGNAYEWDDDSPEEITQAPEWIENKGYIPAPVSEKSLWEVDEPAKLTEAETIATAQKLEPFYEEGKKHNLAVAIGGWLKKRGLNGTDTANVVRLLPSEDPEGRVKDALWAYEEDADFGWKALEELIGLQTLKELDAITPSPADAEIRAAEKVWEARENVGKGGEGFPEVLSPSDSLYANATAGDPTSTGFEILDESLRGGLRPRKMVIIGGAPGAGKTSYCRHLADNLCANGAAVAWLASDEEGVGIQIRRAQAIGLSREDAETANPLGLRERESSASPGASSHLSARED